MNKCARCGQIFRSIFPVGYCNRCQWLNERQSHIEYDERGVANLAEVAAMAQNLRRSVGTRRRWVVR